MDERYTPTEPAYDDFRLLDELPAVLAILVVAMAVAAPLLVAFLLAM